MQDTLCQAAKRGDISGATALLKAIDAHAVDAKDSHGYTPLMCAVSCDAVGVDFVRLLLEHGADPNATAATIYEMDRSVLSIALGAGDPEKVAVLLDAGAELHYSREGYDALIDACHGRDVTHDPRLVPLVELLIARGANLGSVTSYAESGLRVLSRLGRFDAVAVLLAAGADEAQLAWTPLIRAVALGSLADVEAALVGADLEARDWWERTAWIVAVLAGDIDKAALLRDRGADVAACGRCECPAVFYAIQARRHAMLDWLIDGGIPVDVTDRFGNDALIQAAQFGNVHAIDRLLAVGLPVDAAGHGASALWHAVDAATAMRLLDAGADPQQLQHEQRRNLIGFSPEPDIDTLAVNAEDFERGRRRRFGAANPEVMSDPFWRAMVHSGVSGYAAGDRFGLKRTFDERDDPVWCAQRFGQSLTFLPDGRIVQVAGEHEDGYDPDFCIYNDVFVHEPDGTFRIYGYPESVFPPTDFHTATRVGDTLWLIGSLGYAGTRRHGSTPVFRLDLQSFHITAVQTAGDVPGWIYRHRALLETPTRIRVWGGCIASSGEGGEEMHTDNASVFVLDLETANWHRLG